jgi:DNA-binding FadR family transcriptional regulator
MILSTKTDRNSKDFLKIKFQSRAELVVDKITNSIINGELSDGELLPPENQLCEIFGISRQLAIRHFGIKVVIQEHEKIYEAIKNKQPSVAATKMKEHMDGALKRINQVNDLLNKQE